MKKLLLLLVASLTMLFGGCSQFDDSRIWDAIDELEDLYDDLDGRVEDLEEACEKMNTNIEALQTLVTALQNHDTITSIAPIKQGDKVVGYTITFAKSEPITIYHGNDGKNGTDGEDGKDGNNPTIGVAKDADDNYYWTLDGEWLLDADGNKIKANGTDGKDGADGSNGNDGANGENGADGKDGITPRLEIRNGYWYISYDNGATWARLGKATGENGTDGEDGKDSDCLFQSVTWNDEYVFFILSDGTQIIIPRFNTTISLSEIIANYDNNNSDMIYRVVNATIMAVDTHGFIMSDGTDNIYVWLGAGSEHEYQVGMQVEVVGCICEYYDILEFSSTENTPLSIVVTSDTIITPNYDEPILIDDSLSGHLFDIPPFTYVKFTGKLSNNRVYDETTSLYIYIRYPVNADELANLTDEKVTIMGYTFQTYTDDNSASIILTNIVVN